MADKDNIPAFPRHPQSGISWNPACDGMSLRDWFAGQAMPWALSKNYGNDWGSSGKDHAPRAAVKAYAVADAMLKARKGEL